MIKALLTVLTAPCRALKGLIEAEKERRRKEKALIKIVDLLKAEDEIIKNTWKAMTEVMASALEDEEIH